jgi:hypothetical protein
MICLLQDLHDIAPPPKVNTYPLVEYIPIDFPNEIRNEDQHHLMIDQLAYKIPLVHYTDQLTINIIYLLQMQLYPHAIKFTALLCFMMLGNWVKIFHPRNFGVTETLENSWKCPGMSRWMAGLFHDAKVFMKAFLYSFYIIHWSPYVVRNNYRMSTVSWVCFLFQGGDAWRVQGIVKMETSEILKNFTSGVDAETQFGDRGIWCSGLPSDFRTPQHKI